jgi:hypothetical protein
LWQSACLKRACKRENRFSNLGPTKGSTFGRAFHLEKTMRSSYRRNPRQRTNPPKAKYLYFHAAPDAVCDRLIVIPTTMSISADFIDWGPEYEAKIPVAEIEEIKSALVGVLRSGPLSESAGGALSSEGSAR